MDANQPVEHGRLDEPRSEGEARPLLPGIEYHQLRRKVVLATAIVAVVPLTILALIYYQQYGDFLRTQTVLGIKRLLTNNKQSIEFFLTERRSAIEYLVREHDFDNLCDAKQLSQVIRHMNDSFPHGMFVDLELIDSKGAQLCYSGPRDLAGRDYSQQDWFYQVARGGKYTSDVFLGHRNSPHFTVAARHAHKEDDYYILRSTFDADVLGRQLHTAGLGLSDDIFLVNRNGVLQTPSRRFGAVLETIPFSIPPDLASVETILYEDEMQQPIYLGYAAIENSPFILMVVKPTRDEQGGIAVPAKLFIFLGVSIVLILVVILWGSGQFVAGLQRQNIQTASLMHKVEYNNKLASIGRLAAGVAHEINNPLAIINEKAGLQRDLIMLQEDFPKKEKILSLIDSVLESVKRCKAVTHRLLGFAKRMDVQHETLDIRLLIEEVIGFLGKETEYRNIQLAVACDERVPHLESDRGQLQQVFLNLLNNALGAVADGGRINLKITNHTEDAWIAVAVEDNGVGISKQNLPHIFEPFFTTKAGSGTGLGLSITYGIIQKLGGKITVESRVGEGTCFTVLLPTRRAS